MAGVVRLLQLTDCHLKASPEAQVKGWVTEASLAAVVEAAFSPGKARPDAVLATGDITQDGSPEAYARFRERLGGLDTPVLCLPGNHDDPEALGAICREPPFAYCPEVGFGDWRLVLLSTWDGDRGGGRLGEAELTRLETALASAAEAHALVVLHHHPVPVGSRWLDGVALDDAAEFLDIIGAAPRVRGVLWGHVHQIYDTTRRGVRYLGTPSTCFQFRPGTVVPEVDALGPAWRTIDLHPDGSVDTELGWAPWTE